MEDVSPPQADLDAFRKLFWTARKAHRMTRKDASVEDPAHQAALKFAQERHWAWAEHLLDALRLTYAELNEEALALLHSIETQALFRGEAAFVAGIAYYGFRDFDTAIDFYHRALDSPGFETPGYAWNNMGRAYREKKDFDAAIDCYRKALDSPGYDNPGQAWNNMGRAYREKKDPDAAIDCYRKALDAPGYDNPGQAWNNMGRAYREKKDPDAAIDCHRHAIDSPGYDAPGQAWFNMGLAYGEKKDFDAAINCFRKALNSRAYDTPGYAWYNMGHAYDGKREFDAAIDCFRRALDSLGYDTPGQAWFNMGFAYDEKKNFDAAIDCYRRALDSPGYSTPGQAWFNMGFAYGEKKDLDAAIHCYYKALDSPGYDTPGPTWNNVGNAYGEKKDFEAAIDCFHKALNSPGYDTPDQAWNNMGIAYGEKKDFSAAIDCYRKALTSPGYCGPHNIRLNLSIDLREAGLLDEAEEEIQIVLSEKDAEGQHARARRLLSLLQDKREAIPLDPQDVALTAPTPSSLQDGPEAGMKSIFEDAQTQYQIYMDRSVGAHPDDLTILRGWSSSVTLLEGNSGRQWQGGGYFLKWRGKGIVIDPGFDFLDNFHEASFHATEIQAVLVSHNHPDHNSDLTKVDDLLYEIYRIPDSPPPRTLFVLDEDTAAHTLLNKARHRGWAETFRPSEDPDDWLDCKADLDLTIEHFKREHGRDVPNARGLRLRLHRADEGDDFILGYTADGRFTEALVNNLRGCDVLIAHISQPDIREFNDPNFLKEVHLGYNGIIKLLQGLKGTGSEPKLTLIGEFWAGLADLRLPLIEGIRLRSGVKSVYPACLGLSLRLPDLTIRCTHCKVQVDFSEVRLAPPVRPFGLLGYLCGECML